MACNVALRAAALIRECVLYLPVAEIPRAVEIVRQLDAVEGTAAKVQRKENPGTACSEFTSITSYHAQDCPCRSRNV